MLGLKEVSITLIAVALFFCPSQVNAEDLTNRAVEVTYLAGYQAYLSGSYLVCATEFEEIKDSFDLLPGALAQRARLYHASCHQKLGYRAYAAYLLSKMNEAALSKPDQLKYRALASYLKKEIDELDRIYSWIFPYGGSGLFSPQSTFSSASLYGIYGGISVSGWSMGAGFESFNLSMTSGATSYSQLLSNLSVAKVISPSVSLRTNYTNISASGYSSYSGNIFGLGSSIGLGDSATLDLDINGSFYPSLSLGNVNVLQGTMALTQGLVRTQNFWLGIQLTSESIFPFASQRTDTSTGFTLGSSYQRWAGSILTSLGSFLLNINAWTGSECFGVRNQGAMVFNAFRTFHYGYGASATAPVFSGVSLKLSASREQFTASSEKTLADSFLGGLQFNF